MRKQDGSRFWCRLLGQAVDPDRPGEGGTIWIADDVTERRRLDAALAAARDAAEAASRAKSAFLANTSHEIRTPLNGLLGLARLALVESLPPETRRATTSSRSSPARRASTGILSDILDFSKIEAGKFTLETSAFDLRELLAAVQASYRPITDAKGLTLELEVDDGARRRSSTATRCGSARSSATSSPTRSSSRSRAACASSRRRGAAGGVRLAVCRHRPRRRRASSCRACSSRSRRATRRRRGAVGGTGLGLSICRQLARLMGGEVGVESARRRRQHLLGRAAAAAGGAARRRADQRGERERRGCATRTSCWSRTTR